MKQTIDMRGVACPGPVVAVKKKTDDMIAGELLVLVDNQAAVQNLEKFAEYKGFTSSWEKSGEKEFAVQILVGQKALRDVDSYFDIYDRKQEEFVDGTHSAEQEMRPKKAEVKTRPEKETGEKTAPNISGSETAGPERWEREEEETAVCETCELVDAAAVLERIAEGQEFQPPRRRLSRLLQHLSQLPRRHLSRLRLHLSLRLPRAGASRRRKFPALRWQRERSW